MSNFNCPVPAIETFARVQIEEFDPGFEDCFEPSDDESEVPDPDSYWMKVDDFPF